MELRKIAKILELSSNVHDDVMADNITELTKMEMKDLQKEILSEFGNVIDGVRQFIIDAVWSQLDALEGSYSINRDEPPPKDQMEIDLRRIVESIKQWKLLYITQWIEYIMLVNSYYDGKFNDINYLDMFAEKFLYEGLEGDSVEGYLNTLGGS